MTNSGSGGFRPRSQRRVRAGFAPASLSGPKRTTQDCQFIIIEDPNKRSQKKFLTYYKSTLKIRSGIRILKYIFTTEDTEGLFFHKIGRCRFYEIPPRAGPAACGGFFFRAAMTFFSLAVPPAKEKKDVLCALRGKYAF
jgi:hypothetical protein